MAITLAGIKSVPVVGSFVSRIFKKPSSPDGFGKFVIVFSPPYFWAGQYRPFAERQRKNPLVDKFIRRQPMIATEKSQCAKKVLSLTQNWCKTQKANIQQAIANIRVVAEPTPPKPVQVHTVSASYNTQAQTKQATKGRDVQEVIQAGISKIPIYVLVGIGALFILPQLLRTRGGKE